MFYQTNMNTCTRFDYVWQYYFIDFTWCYWTV